MGQMDGGKGSFFSLGEDVHCLFYKPSGEALAMPSPKECLHALTDHAALSGVRFEVGYAAALEAFTDVLESRKEGLGGRWFRATGESTADAFMRRLKRSDPAFAIFQAYAEEHAERWAEAKTLTVAEAMAQMPEVERKYKIECAEYDTVVYGISEEFSAAAKLEQEKISKLADRGELQALLDSGTYAAVQDGVLVKDATSVSGSNEEFEANRDKA